MNNDDTDDDVESETTSNTPPTDTSGAKSVDQAKEEEAEALRRKIAEIERKVADGN
ncbi:hypothetical protein [Pseudomonas sp. ANT_H12B]|uniref:hypothetical protein n=1 Tax=Pseudomonas sp. ANT_H12B TaxID=2597348 RepID=UPI0015B605BF|nr:hypothetical protein [Pseudomonas sp. ANT_H12B]